MMLFKPVSHGNGEEQDQIKNGGDQRGLDNAPRNIKYNIFGREVLRNFNRRK